ncbi:hypothetical protein [Natronomonas gomsonensis]|uniref:hypothetical protein n=1 Tax=Natronomonas gomsonensis TaxID=1046043 RepID=UPI0015B98CF5|nr:hypothetical protein [Natronomonas gomsonensis]
MASHSAGRRRTVCETCNLPFYADSGACPYCDTDGSTADADADAGGFVFEAPETTERTRTTCQACGLPHYDDLEACPYCERAGGTAVEADSPDSPDGPTESAPSADERSGLFGRIKRTLGF